MITSLTINNKRRAVVLELEDIDPADFPGTVTTIIACVTHLDATAPVEVCEDSAVNPIEDTKI